MTTHQQRLVAASPPPASTLCNMPYHALCECVQVLDDYASAALGGRKSTASRISRFASFPPVLVLVLKRYYVAGADEWLSVVVYVLCRYCAVLSAALLKNLVLVLVLKRYYVAGVSNHSAVCILLLGCANLLLLVVVCERCHAAGLMWGLQLSSATSVWTRFTCSVVLGELVLTRGSSWSSVVGCAWLQLGSMSAALLTVCGAVLVLELQQSYMKGSAEPSRQITCCISSVLLYAHHLRLSLPALSPHVHRQLLTVSPHVGCELPTLQRTGPPRSSRWKFPCQRNFTLSSFAATEHSQGSSYSQKSQQQQQQQQMVAQRQQQQQQRRSLIP
jgi:hypothetical protein